MYAKLQNFIQLCLTLTKLCHIKCDHLMNFYISLRNAKIAISLQQYDLPAQNSAGWCTNVSVKCTAFKISTLKSEMADSCHLKVEKSRYLTMQNVSVMRFVRLPS